MKMQLRVRPPGWMRNLTSGRREFLLGAAIGTGMAAKAAQRGGADFLLALSAGRFRSMGLPSAACLLAFRDSNRWVFEFGRSEVLTQTSLPVFFGAMSIGTEDTDDLVKQIALEGFEGVTNFPTCTFLDGRYRQFLEESDLGFNRELAMLKIARAQGLATLAYVHTFEEAQAAAAAGVDVVNLDFGWNMGGMLGVKSSVGLKGAASLGHAVFEKVRSINPQIRCFIEGGPIVTAEQMDDVCQGAGADGYIGGSTIDRVPLESAIEMATGAFKTIGRLRKQINLLESQLDRKGSVDALIGVSQAMECTREQVARAINSEAPVFIIGELGTGHRDVAKLIHESRDRRGKRLIIAECKTDDDMELQLFGSVGAAGPRRGKTRTGLLELARGSTLVLENIEKLEISVQRRVVKAAETGSFRPRGSPEDVPIDVRFITISYLATEPESNAQSFDPHFFRWVRPLRVELPPLRERLEDLPMLAEFIARGLATSGRRGLDSSAYRALMNYHWPGNLGELRTVLQSAGASARADVLRDRDLLSYLKAHPPLRSDARSFSSEREWILDGLRRNRFRRAETAQFLRVSRKTLYNKILQYGLPVRDASDGLAHRRVRSKGIR